MKARLMILAAALALVGTTAQAAQRSDDPNDAHSAQGQRYKAHVKSSIGCKYASEGNHSQVPRIQRSAAAADAQKPNSASRNVR